jgi:hypothetical protein
MDEPEPADLSDKATLFQAYVDLINSEQETIWARHNALLVANSLIVGALALTPSGSERIASSVPGSSSAQRGF